MSTKSFLLLTATITFFTSSAFSMIITDEEIKNTTANPTLCPKALVPFIERWAQKNERPAREKLGFTDDDRSRDDPSYPGYAIAVKYFGHPDFLVNARFNEKSHWSEFFSFWDPKHPKYLEAASKYPSHPYNEMINLQKDHDFAKQIAKNNPNHPYIKLLIAQDPHHILFKEAAKSDPKHHGHIAYLYETGQFDPNAMVPGEDLENAYHPGHVIYVLRSPNHPKHKEFKQSSGESRIKSLWANPNRFIGLEPEDPLYPSLVCLAKEHPQYLMMALRTPYHPEYWKRAWTDVTHPKYEEFASLHPHHPDYKKYKEHIVRCLDKNHPTCLIDSNHSEYRKLAWTNPDHPLYFEYAKKYSHHPEHASQKTKAAHQ